MNQEYENRLEKLIDRELKNLPAMKAPAGLSARILAAVEKKVRVPWYRRAWQTWPIALQVISVVLLLTAILGAYMGCAYLIQGPAVTSFAASVKNSLSGLGAALNVLSALGNAVMLVVKSMGTTAVVTCVLLVVFGYTSCVGLGSVYLRLAMARKY
jgi:hypothetical protein